MKQYMQCTSQDNCLEIFNSCDRLNLVCVMVIPPIQLIVIKDGIHLTKYRNHSLQIEDVVAYQLFPRRKKLVIVHGVDSETETANIAVFRFQKSIQHQLLSQNYVKLAKQSHFKSAFEIFLNDRSCLNISLSVFDVFVVYRLRHPHACFVYVNGVISCFALIEPHFFDTSGLNIKQIREPNTKVSNLVKEVLKYVIPLNLLIFVCLFVKESRVDYKDHLTRSLHRQTVRFV